jgi:hypothetical protein
VALLVWLVLLAVCVLYMYLFGLEGEPVFTISSVAADFSQRTFFFRLGLSLLVSLELFVEGTVRLEES